MLLELKNVQKTYATKGGVTFRALSNVSATFDGSGLVYLVGASGSGKSTLLNVIGGLDGYDGGEVTVAGRNMKTLKKSEIDSLRSTMIGFVFQEFNLIDTLTVKENVALALDMQSDTDYEKVFAALKSMGIEDKALSKTKDLSGGQRQRVAIARALVKNPRIILADEPTGSLDSATSEEVTAILKEISLTRLVIVVTHDMDTALAQGDRIIEMKDGKIYRDVVRKKEGEEAVVSDAEFFSDTLMTVPKGVKLTDADVADVNRAIKESGRKTFVNIETDPRKMKALFPNLREAVEIGQNGETEKRNEPAKSGEFVPYRGSKTKQESVEFKRSRLPFRNVLLLGLNNLNFKKARLALTVIVAFIAFALFGASQALANFNEKTAIAETIRGDKISRVSLSVAGWGYYDEKDVAALEKAGAGAKVYPQYGLAFFLDGSMTSGSSQVFSNVVEAENVTDLGYTMLAGSGSCSGYDRVIISEVVALDLVFVGGSGRNKFEETVGRKIKMTDGTEFVVDGVFKCEKYAEFFKRGEASDYRYIFGGECGRLFVKPGFVKQFGMKYMSSEPPVRVVMHGNDNIKGDELMSLKFGANAPAEGAVSIVGDGSVKNPTDVILPERYAKQLFGLATSGLTADADSAVVIEKIKRLNSDSLRRFVLESGASRDGVAYAGTALLALGNFTIVAIKPSTNGETDTIILHESQKETILPQLIQSSALLSTVDYDKAADFVKAVYDNGFEVNEYFCRNYSTTRLIVSVLTPVLKGLSLLFCALVVLLLYNFISLSIKLTSRHIGILRALGAKKSDTFKIYALEGVAVSLLSYLLAVVAIVIGSPLIGMYLGSAFYHYFVLFFFGIDVFATMALLALVVTVVSILIPLRKFTRITPVRAIGGKE